jgi:hypothetical protein
MATILFAVALQRPIITIDDDDDVRATQPDLDTTGACGFADDVGLHRDGEQLMDNIVRYHKGSSSIRDGHGALPRQINAKASRE